MTPEEAKLTIDYLKEMQEEYIEGEGYERYPLPEWYALDKAIETIEQTTWIPVCERLPQYTADYTVTVGINNGDGMYYEVRTALYQIRFNQWIVYESEKTLVGEVIAWQESPEPYKAERE